MIDRDHPDRAPTPQEICAFCDGELSDLDRRRIEQWLREHPPTLAQWQAWRSFQESCRHSQPVEPTEAEWNTILGRIDDALRNPTAKRARGNWRLTAAMSAAAAVLVVAVAMHGDRESALRSRDVEIFPVASPDDVEIISVDAHGANAVVIGELPLRNPIVLMEPGDATLKSVERNHQELFSEVRMQPDAEEAPMILGPVASGAIARP